MHADADYELEEAVGNGTHVLESLDDILMYHHAGLGQKSAPKCLPGDLDIRCEANLLLLPRMHRSQPPHTAHHLVEYRESAALPAEITHSVEVSVDRAHASECLDRCG